MAPLTANPGDDESEVPASLEHDSSFDTDLGRLSGTECWSTGKKLQSFLSRMQF